MAAPLLQDNSDKRVIAVDLDDLSSRAARMAQKAKEVNALVKSMGDEVVGLCERWKGPNRDRFAEYITYNVNFMALSAYGDYLTSYAEALDRVVKLYENLELEVNAVVAGRPSKYSRQS